MRQDVRRRHYAHERAYGVCAEHHEIFGSSGGGQRLLADYGAHVKEIERLLTAQKVSIETRRGATQEVRRLRRSLRDIAKVIVRVGKLVTVDDPAIAAMELIGPASDGDLLAYARGLFGLVSPHVEAFAAAGLTPERLQSLADRTEGLAAARDAQADARQGYTAAAAALRDTLGKADKTVGALEAIAIDTPAAHPEVLTKLRAAKRVGRNRREPAVDTADPAPTDQAA